MERLDPRLRRIIDEGMRAAQPDARSEARVLDALLRRLPPSDPTGGDGPPTADASPLGTVFGSLSTMKLAIVAAVGAAAVVGVIAVGSRNDASVATGAPITQPSTAPTHERDASTANVASLPPVITAPAPPIAPSIEPATPSDRVAPRPAPTPAASAAAPTASADAIVAELALISAAEAALAEGDDRRALTLAKSHADRHPQGQLALEREAIAAAASCGLKDPDAARRAAAFLAAHPRAAAAAKVRARCGEKSQAR